MRLATIALITVALGACNDLRGFEGVWQGPRVGDSPVLSVGIAPMATASLTIGGIDTNGIRGTLSIDGYTYYLGNVVSSSIPGWSPVLGVQHQLDIPSSAASTTIDEFVDAETVYTW